MASQLYICIVVTVICVYNIAGLAHADIKDVRLVDGPNPNEGTVEIQEDDDDDTWKTTCGTNLGITDVVAICAFLRFPGANRAIVNTPYPLPPQSTPRPTPEVFLQCPARATLEQCQVGVTSVCQSTAGAAKCYDERYLGCFTDISTSCVLTGDSLVGGQSMTIDFCIRFCMNSTNGVFAFAGVENGNECYCGEADAEYDRLGTNTDLECQSQCSGDDNESCGGVGAIAVFAVVPDPGSTEETATTATIKSNIMTSVTPPGPMTQPPTPLVTTSDGGGATVMTSRRTLPSNLPQQSMTGLYAGVGGGVVVIIIVIIVVVAIVFIIRKKRRSKPPKDILKSRELPPASSPRPKDMHDNTYDGLYHDISDETAASVVAKPNNQSPEDGEVYYSAVRDNGTSPKGESNGNAVVNLYEDAPLSKDEPASHDDLSALYAMPDKTQNGADFGDLYAKPDKSSKVSDHTQDANFGELYAMPDKSRGKPEGREEDHIGDLYATPDKSGKTRVHAEAESGGDALYSSADDTGLYATSTDNGSHTVNADGQYGTVMVDNELYTV